LAVAASTTVDQVEQGMAPPRRKVALLDDRVLLADA
jgi:hypothetical protein